METSRERHEPLSSKEVLERMGSITSLDEAEKIIQEYNSSKERKADKELAMRAIMEVPQLDVKLDGMPYRLIETMGGANFMRLELYNPYKEKDEVLVQRTDGSIETWQVKEFDHDTKIVKVIKPVGDGTAMAKNVPLKTLLEWQVQKD